MLCDDIRLVHDEFVSEIEEHDVLKKLRKLKTLTGISQKQKRELHEYEQYAIALKAIKAAKARYCNKKQVEVKRSDILLLRRIWRAEITKYHVGWLQKYKNILSAMDRILREIK